MDNEEYQKAVINELKRISGYLALLASDKLAERQEKLQAKYLTTGARKKMWALMDDGSRNIADIAKEVTKEVRKVSAEAVRIFVKKLEKDGLVEVREEGRNRYPRWLI